MIRHPPDDSPAVSTVVGVVLLVGIAVVLAAVAAYFVIGLDAPSEVRADIVVEDRSDGSSLIKLEDIGNADEVLVTYVDAEGEEFTIPLTKEEPLTVPHESTYQVIASASGASSPTLLRDATTDHGIDTLSAVPVEGEEYEIFRGDPDDPETKDKIGIEISDDGFDEEKTEWHLRCGNADKIITGPTKAPGFVDNNCKQIDVSAGTGPDHQHHVNSKPPGQLKTKDKANYGDFNGETSDPDMHGTITDSNGDPIPEGSELTVTADNGNLTTTTDASGYYELDTVDESSMDVSWSVTNATTGEEVSGTEEWMGPGEYNISVAWSESTPEMYGTITDADGNTAPAGTTVAILDAADQTTEYGRTDTDSDGYYTLSDLGLAENAQYIVSMTSPDASPSTKEFTYGGPGEYNFQAEWTYGDTTLSNIEIDGIVEDTDGRVEGATLTIEAPDGQTASQQTGVDGEYLIGFTDTVSGEYTFTVEGDGKHYTTTRTLSNEYETVNIQITEWTVTTFTYECTGSTVTHDLTGVNEIEVTVIGAGGGSTGSFTGGGAESITARVDTSQNEDVRVAVGCAGQDGADGGAGGWGWGSFSNGNGGDGGGTAAGGGGLTGFIFSGADEPTGTFYVGGGGGAGDADNGGGGGGNGGLGGAAAKGNAADGQDGGSSGGLTVDAGGDGGDGKTDNAMDGVSGTSMAGGYNVTHTILSQNENMNSAGQDGKIIIKHIG